MHASIHDVSVIQKSCLSGIVMCQNRVLRGGLERSNITRTVNKKGEILSKIK